jgi:hypothetical protein
MNPGDDHTNPDTVLFGVKMQSDFNSSFPAYNIANLAEIIAFRMWYAQFSCS